jgi:hypothetical protein
VRIQVEFPDGPVKPYTYECRVPVKVGDLVAVPANVVSTEGTVAVVTKLEAGPHRGPIKEVIRVIPEI